MSNQEHQDTVILSEENFLVTSAVSEDGENFLILAADTESGQSVQLEFRPDHAAILFDSLGDFLNSEVDDDE